MKKSTKAAIAATPALIAPSTTAPRPAAPPIDFARRRANRELPTEQVIQLLQREAPGIFNLAEVVGRWVWVQFREKQPPQVTSVLAELGFHWNNRRQAWQHPCGGVMPAMVSDPHQKYPTYFPSDVKAA